MESRSIVLGFEGEGDEGDDNSATHEQHPLMNQEDNEFTSEEIEAAITLP